MKGKQLNNLLALGEGFTTEFKRSGTSNLGREHGAAEPRIKVPEHLFTVIFPRPNVQSEKEIIAITPEDTPEVTPEVHEMLSVLDGEMTRRDIMRALQLSDEKHFREHYQQAAVRLGLMEMTIPDKPRSPNQRYRLTGKGKQLLRRGKP